jgi:hypothetical protein
MASFLSLLPGTLMLGASMGSDFLPFAGLSLVQGLSSQLLGNPLDVPGPDQTQYGGNLATWGMDGSSKAGIYTENYGNNGILASMNSFGVSPQSAYGFSAPFNYGAMNPSGNAFPTGGRNGMQGYLPNAQQCAPYYGAYQQCPPQGPACYQPNQPFQSFNYGGGPNFNPGQFGNYQPQSPANGGFWMQQFYGGGSYSPFPGGGYGGQTPPVGGGGYGSGGGVGSGGSGGAGGPGTYPIPPAPSTPVGPGTPGGLTPAPVVVNPPIPPLVLPPLTPPVPVVPNPAQAQTQYDNLVPHYQELPIGDFLSQVASIGQLAGPRASGGVSQIGAPGTQAPFTVNVSSYYNQQTQEYVPVQEVLIADRANYSDRTREYNVGQLTNFSATMNNAVVGHEYQVTVNWNDGQSKVWNYQLNNSNNGQIAVSSPYSA